MKSRDEIVIIMLQWLRLYTLGSRGSRELKTFLETHLISSRVDQKLKNKEREIHAFKEGIRPEIVASGTSRERRLKRHGSDSLVRCRCSEFEVNSTSN